MLIETLVEQYPRQSELKILDIGTGSGCLLLSALSEFPCASGVGVDISADALHVAQLNARAHGLSDRVELLQFDLSELPSLKAAARQAHGQAAYNVLYQQFDAVICNPPYIPRNELHLVAPDVLSHEPHLALFSDGPDAVNTIDKLIENEEDPKGLRMYHYLQQSVGHLFRPSGSPHKLNKRSLILEIGSEAQAQAVKELFATSSTLECQKFLIDGQQRHRGLLFQSDE